MKGMKEITGNICFITINETIIVRFLRQLLKEKPNDMMGQKILDRNKYIKNAEQNKTRAPILVSKRIEGIHYQR